MSFVKPGYDIIEEIISVKCQIPISKIIDDYLTELLRQWVIEY